MPQILPRLCGCLVLVSASSCGVSSPEPSRAAVPEAPTAAPSTSAEEAAHEGGSSPRPPGPSVEIQVQAGERASDGTAPPLPQPEGASPALDSPDAIRAALVLAAGNVERLLQIVDLRAGLDVDFDRVMGHWAHRACDTAELRQLRDWLSDDDLALYALDENMPFSCSADLSRCISCDADLAGCPNGTLFELAVDPDGRRYLAGVIPRATQDHGTANLHTVEDFARIDVGHFAEVGVRCRLRSWMSQGAGGDLWEVRIDPAGSEEARHLCGEAAADRLRELSSALDVTSYCDADRCFAYHDEDALGMFWEGTVHAPRLRLVTRGPAQCEGCAPTPSRAMRRRVRTTRCPPP